MKNKIIKFLIMISVGVISWLLLSFLFFPIEANSSVVAYFRESILNMLPLKAVITLVFVLICLFFYEQKIKNDLKR